MIATCTMGAGKARAFVMPRVACWAGRVRATPTPRPCSAVRCASSHVRSAPAADARGPCGSQASHRHHPGCGTKLSHHSMLWPRVTAWHLSGQPRATARWAEGWGHETPHDALRDTLRAFSADAALRREDEEEERREDITEDTLVFTATNTWKFRSLGAVGFVKAMVWSYLGYTCYFYPDASLAANTVKEIVRTQGGMMARITTFNVFGGANAPAEFKIEHLTSKDMGKGYDHIRVGTAKSFLLCDQKGRIPNRSAYNNLINGRTILHSNARHNVRWLEAKDPQSGKTYWYHPLTRQTSWTPPRGQQSGSKSAAVVELR